MPSRRHLLLLCVAAATATALVYYTMVTDAGAADAQRATMAPPSVRRANGLDLLAALARDGQVPQLGALQACLATIEARGREECRSRTAFQYEGYPRFGEVRVSIGRAPGPIAVYQYTDNAPRRQTTMGECSAALDVYRAQAQDLLHRVSESCGVEPGYRLYGTQLVSGPERLVFIFRRETDGIWVNDWLRIGIGLHRELAGQVVDLEWESYPHPADFEIRLTDTAARKVADRHSQADVDGYLAQHLELMVSRSKGIDATVWHLVSWSAQPDALGTAVVGLVHQYIDARTGELLLSSCASASVTDVIAVAPPLRAKGLRAAPPVHDDAWPAWIDVNKLVLVSNRLHAGPDEVLGQPQTAYVRSSALFMVEDSSFWLLFPAVRAGPGWPSRGSQGLVLFSLPPNSIGLSVETGRWHLYGTPDRPVDGITGGWERQRLCFTARRRHGDQDVFCADLDTEGNMGAQWRAANLDGEDVFPVLLGDGERLVFAHNEGGSRYRRGYSVFRCKAGAPYWENPQPERVVGGFGRIMRIARFPDDRLLVWHTGGLDIVDLRARSAAPARVPELRDPDLPGGQPLKIRDPAVSPDGRKLAFSGFRCSGKPEGPAGWYIYTCNLDGSELKRVTPVEDEPIPPYVFPQTGKTAFDVAKEIALARMEQEQ